VADERQQSESVSSGSIRAEYFLIYQCVYIITAIIVQSFPPFQFTMLAFD
jgi:hypothetical protein